MKKTSVPEQAILFYIRKYIDPFAENNAIRIGRYIADITFIYNNQKYNIEYDSKSQHIDRMEKDIERNKVFLSQGYNVIRMRDKGLKFIPNCINIRFDFQNYSKNSLIRANSGINELLALFGIYESIDISNDLKSIRNMYYNAG
ncbi:MAG: DUF559 domain-containing protein [Acutalibacteraceae bacterium]|nr:DUF559 domain-containing protein [Acutalibacteraceae bacterium]